MSFTFSSRSKSLFINNAVLGTIPKRLVFTMLKNSDFLGSLDSKPYNFRHFKINSFALNVNGKQISSEASTLNMGNEKTSVIGYKTLFGGSGIQHSNSGLEVTHDMYIKRVFMLIFDNARPGLGGMTYVTRR
jgi:hypothetical protein